MHAPTSLQGLADGYDSVGTKLAAILLRTPTLLAENQ